MRGVSDRQNGNDTLLIKKGGSKLGIGHNAVLGISAIQTSDSTFKRPRYHLAKRPHLPTPASEETGRPMRDAKVLSSIYKLLSVMDIDTRIIFFDISLVYFRKYYEPPTNAIKP